MAPPPRRSWVWEHFSVSENSLEAVCQLCKDVMHHRGSTSPLIKHLRSVHSLVDSPNDPRSLEENSSFEDDSREYQASTSAKRCRRCEASSSSVILPTRPCSADRIERIDKALTKMIAQTMMPIATVANPAFINFVKILEAGYKVPTPPTVTSRIKLAYVELRDKIKEKLRQVEAVVISTDCWTSRAQDSYITVSVYTIDESWAPKTYVLTTEEMEERHTAVNLSSKLRGIIEEWGLVGKVTAVVTDNAANILAALRLMHDDIEEPEGVTCAAHTIQLAVNVGLQEKTIDLIISKVSKLVGHFSSSDIASTALEKAQIQLSKEPKKLIQSCKTRWNSTYFMLERLVENRISVLNVISDRSITTANVAQKLEISEGDWIIIEDLIKTLQPLQMATTVLCSDTMSPISMTRPVIRAVLEKHLADTTHNSCLIAKLKKTVFTELTRRFKMDQIAPSTAQIASLLDPRYKDLVAENEEAKIDIRSIVSNKILSSGEMFEEGDGASGMSIDQENCLDFLFQTSSNSRDPQAQLMSYVCEPQILHNMSPFEWWKNHEQRYPAVAKLAKRYLAIPASSAGSERVFSTAGNIVTAKRSCLLPENVNKLVFLYQNRCLFEE